MKETYSMISPVRITAKIAAALSYLADASPYKICVNKAGNTLKSPLSSIIGLLWMRIDKGDILTIELTSKQLTLEAGRYTVEKIKELLDLYATL